jgi:hypothetical protein
MQRFYILKAQVTGKLLWHKKGATPNLGLKKMLYIQRISAVVLPKLRGVSHMQLQYL